MRFVSAFYINSCNNGGEYGVGKVKAEANHLIAIVPRGAFIKPLRPAPAGARRLLCDDCTLLHVRQRKHRIVGERAESLLCNEDDANAASGGFQLCGFW